MLPDGWFFDGDIATYRTLASGIPVGGRMAELGVWMGRSLCSIADILRERDIHVVAVDTFRGSKSEPNQAVTAADKDIRLAFEESLCQHNLTDRVNIIERTSSEAADDTTGPLDLIFIDADHTYASVKLDIELWRKKLSPHGVMAGHDYSWPGVRNAVHAAFPSRSIKVEGNIWYVRMENLLKDDKPNPVAGLVGVSCAELGRHSLFYNCLLHLDCPPGTVPEQARGANIADNRNKLTQRAMEIGAQWVFYLDDDGSFAPDILNKLLASNKDIVSGLYLNRQPPFTPQCFDHEDENGYVKSRLLRPHDRGLVKVKAVGAGCLLVRRRVFEALSQPWWTLGQISKDAWGDDVDFCRRARAAGFDIWCDLDVTIGHLMQVAAWPVRGEDGKWMTVIAQDQPIAVLPAAHRGLEVDPGIVVAK